MTIKKLNQSIDKLSIALWIGIITHTIKRKRICHHALKRLLIHRIELRNACRVTTAQHIDWLIAIERITKIVHQLQDGAVFGEFLTKF